MRMRPDTPMTTGPGFPARQNGHAAAALRPADGAGLCYNFTMSNGEDPAAPPVPDSGFDARDVALRARLSGIVGRDEADLAALYDATASRLYALALRIVGDRPGAEEVVADTYFQVWEQAERYDPKRGKVMHWLYMICRSRALDYLR